MLKDLIISGLLIYIFSKVPGWAVDGVQKVAVCLFLTILGAILIHEVEDFIKELRK